MSNKKGIEKHCEYLESKIRKKQNKIERLQQENTNLNQALNEIKEIVIELKDDSDSFDYDIVKEHKETILQIIDKVGGNDERS